MLQNPYVCSVLTRCTIPCACHAKRHLNLKVARTPGVFNILTSKCASRHNGVHFFDISTNAPTLLCFAFLLGNVLRATTACTFSTSQLPKVVREWCVLYILTCICASRHNGVQFFISHLATWAPAALASLLFDPSQPQIIGKTQCFATFLPFLASASSFFLLFFLLIFLFSLPLPCSAFHLSILSEV